MPTSRGGFIEIDGHEVRQLEVDLAGAPMRVKWNQTSWLRRSARLVDKQMRVDAAGHQGNYFGIPGTEFATPLEDHVSHELIGPDTAEIGIEKKGAGKLAHIIVYGSVNNAPVYDHTAALRRSTKTIVEWAADAAEESVLGDD